MQPSYPPHDNCMAWCPDPVERLLPLGKAVVVAGRVCVCWIASCVQLVGWFVCFFAPRPPGGSVRANLGTGHPGFCGPPTMQFGDRNPSSGLVKMLRCSWMCLRLRERREPEPRFVSNTWCNATYCGWTKSCTTWKPWETIVCWCLQGNHHARDS